MKQVVVTVFLLALLTSLSSTQAVAGPQSQSAPPPMPKVVTWEPGGRPVWVDASLVLTSSGAVDPKLFAPSAVSVIQTLLALPEVGGCIQATEVTSDYLFIVGVTPPKAQSLAESIKTSELIMVGAVTNKSYGFSDQIAGELVQIKPEVLIKDSQGRQDYYYLFIPVGTFRVGGKLICKTDQREATPPEVGEHIAVLLRATTRGTSNFIFPSEASHITIKSDGSLLAPEHLKPGLPATKSELLQVLKRASAPGGAR